MFVGEQGDLLWRALTETDNNGRSPLKQGLINDNVVYIASDMVAAGALYDEPVAAQLTTDLTTGVEAAFVDSLRTNVHAAFTEALNAGIGECRWTEEQQDKLRGFIEVLETDER